MSFSMDPDRSRFWNHRVADGILHVDVVPDGVRVTVQKGYASKSMVLAPEAANLLALDILRCALIVESETDATLGLRGDDDDDNDEEMTT